MFVLFCKNQYHHLGRMQLEIEFEQNSPITSVSWNPSKKNCLVVAREDSSLLYCTVDYSTKKIQSQPIIKPSPQNPSLSNINLCSSSPDSQFLAISRKCDRMVKIWSFVEESIKSSKKKKKKKIFLLSSTF